MSDLDTLARPPRLFQARRKVFPKAVQGPFRRFKWVMMGITLLIYYSAPWLRWDRGPYAPKQAILVDLAHRRFYMFSIEIWPHEFYYVAGLLVMAAIGLFLVTSAVGRAWCGYACPQTVWTDLFQHVERLVEGDRNAQLRLQHAPWGVRKIAKRVTKHVAWLLIGMLTGGAWIFYFADAPTLAAELINGDAPFVAYATIAVLTATTYVLGGLLREQVCQYMCPWPRIQAAMMDERSLTVTYKFWRGEPRTHGVKRAAAQVAGPSLADMARDPDTAAQSVGDCIDCNACVAVCPTGIDIRQGPQIGCITCGLCIDACDDAMQRVGRKPKLIGYTTEIDAKAARTGAAVAAPLRRLVRPRTIIYLSIWSSLGAAMLLAVNTRTHIGVSVLQNRNPQWVRLSDGSIRNTYQVKVRNMEARPRDVAISISGMPGVLWDEQHSREQAGDVVGAHVDADKVAKFQLFVAATSRGPVRDDLRFTVRAIDSEGGQAFDDTYFERPGDTK